MAARVLKTIAKRIVLPCSVLLILYLIFIMLVFDQIAVVNDSATSESNQASQHNQFKIEDMKPRFAPGNNVGNNGKRYDSKLAEIVSKLEHNVANNSKQSILSKIRNAGIISHDNTFAQMPLKRNSITTNLLNGSSQQIRFVYVPHPAKISNKQRTDEERTITTKTQDLQEERQKVLKAVCDENRKLHNLSSYERMDYVLTDKDNRLIYAMVPKVASTTWIQLMIIHSGKSFDRTVSFHDINYRREHITQYGLLYMHSFTPEEQYNAIQNYYSWVFTRNPFERLVSAYRNKLNPGIPWYHERYGRDIAMMVRSGRARRGRGDDITFPEFIRYLVRTGKYKGFFDEHWRPMYQLAYPCIVKYDFIGKLDTLHDDIKYVLNKAYGLDPVDDTPFKNSSRRTNQSVVAGFYKEVPQSDVELLKEIYSLDFQLFDYSTDLPTA